MFEDEEFVPDEEVLGELDEEVELSLLEDFVDVDDSVELFEPFEEAPFELALLPFDFADEELSEPALPLRA